MKSHGTEPDDDIAYVGEDVNEAVPVAQAILDTHDSQAKEHEIRQRVDEFCNVRRDVVVLLAACE